MSSFPGSPRVLRGGLVLVDPKTSELIRVVALQYNPDSLSRTLQVQGITGEANDMMEQLRLKGPPIETIKVEATIDATDQLEFPEQNPNAVELGIHPQLAALESIIYPSSEQLADNNDQAALGTIEILPVAAPLQLFVWSPQRILPVRITDFSVTEEAFDVNLNPIRAKVSLGMRVLSVNDVGFDSKAGSLFVVHHQQKERFSLLASSALGALGLQRLP